MPTAAGLAFPYHGFCAACTRSAPRGYVPIRERLTLENLCALCARLKRLYSLLNRLEREHDLFFFILDQIELFEAHLLRALQVPPGHSSLERYLVITDPAPVSSGTRSIPVNAPLIIYTSSSEDERARLDRDEPED